MTNKMLKNGLFSNVPPMVTKIGQPLSDIDIIALHKAFLTPGYHYLRVSSCNEGRVLIKEVLSSMKYYQQIACLTLEKKLLDDYIINLYEDISIQTNNVDEYFIEHFHYDFLWIELSSVMAIKWMNDFYQALHDYHIDQTIPIIGISFDTE